MLSEMIDNIKRKRESVCWGNMTQLIKVSLIFAGCIIQGLTAPLGTVIRQSRVEVGSTVSLIGLIHQKLYEPYTVLWFKGSRQIPFVNTDRYTFVDGATTLIINQFDQADTGSYLFVYANNVTRKRVLFHLDLRPSSSYHWYEGNSKTVGTVIGMLFLCLMMFALAYYCCSRDADTGFPSLQIKQFQSPVALNNNNNNGDGFGYSGVKFTSGVSIPNNGRRKKSREVRRDSITALGAVSKYNFKRHKRKKNIGRRKCSAATTNAEPSSPTLL